MREETMIVMTSDDVFQAIFEYLDGRGIDCSDGRVDFCPFTQNGEYDFECKITGVKKKYA